jgi:hypothetical protein
MCATIDRDLPLGATPAAFQVAGRLACLPDDEQSMLAEVLTRVIDGQLTEADVIAAAGMYRNGKLTRHAALAFLLGANKGRA